MQGEGLVVGNGAAVRDTVTIDPSEVTAVTECGAAPLKRKGRRLRARWPLCLKLGGEVRLRARVNADCGTMNGKLVLVTAGSTRGFSARLSHCGDGVVDYGRGEECDDANDTAGDGCEPACTVPPREVPGAALTSATASGTVLEQMNLALSVGNLGGKILFALTVVSRDLVLCNGNWHLVQDGRQFDLANEPDASRGIARVAYDGFSGCGTVSQGVTVRGSFEDFPPAFDLRRPFQVRYDFTPFLGFSTCRNADVSVCDVAVP